MAPAGRSFIRPPLKWPFEQRIHRSRDGRRSARGPRQPGEDSYSDNGNNSHTFKTVQGVGWLVGGTYVYIAGSQNVRGCMVKKPKTNGPAVVRTGRNYYYNGMKRTHLQMLYEVGQRCFSRSICQGGSNEEFGHFYAAPGAKSGSFDFLPTYMLHPVGRNSPRRGRFACVNRSPKYPKIVESSLNGSIFRQGEPCDPLT